jgi:uncharacterized protein (TIGR00730 family)
MGHALVERDAVLVFGGGSVGLMGVVADAVLERGGTAVGVIPRALDRREIAHRGLSELYVVDSMHERKAKMAELADAFVALPGGLGTLEEVIEAATWTQLGIHIKPVGLLDVEDYWRDLTNLLDHAVRERFISLPDRDLVCLGREPHGLLDQLERWSPSPRSKWLSPGQRVLEGIGPRGPLVGASAVVVRDGQVLLGLRRGTHGPGTWSFPGGKVDAGEAPEQAVVRELEEETGLVAATVSQIAWTDDVFVESGLQYVTLHYLVEATGKPQRREPDKFDGWSWHPWDDLPQPLFRPVASLLATGWHPSTTL